METKGEFIRPTPRTDAEANKKFNSQFEFSTAMIRLARQLERELSAAEQRIGELSVAKQLLADGRSTQHKAQKKPSIRSVSIEALSNDDVMEKLRRYGHVAATRREFEGGQ